MFLLLQISGFRGGSVLMWILVLEWRFGDSYSTHKLWPHEVYCLS